MLSILKSAFYANNKEIGIVSNNIANVNSTAFKKSKTKWQDPSCFFIFKMLISA